MTERKKDIDVHKEMLKSQIKTLDSERQTVKQVFSSLTFLQFFIQH